jgi:hypothetical protein
MNATSLTKSARTTGLSPLPTLHYATNAIEIANGTASIGRERAARKVYLETNFAPDESFDDEKE